MKKNIKTSLPTLILSVTGVGLMLTFYCCSSGTKDKEDRQARVKLIDSLQGKIFNPQSMQMDKNLAAKGIAAYQEFVKKFPEDSLCAEYLFRSSDLSRAIGDNRNAIDFLSQICKNYPAYRKIPECLFLQGYYYQEYFKDTVQAKNFYNQLISKYPTHAFVDDAQALMKMFGKSEEEIIRDFEKKDAEKKKI